MATKRSKRYQKAAEQVEDRPYSLDDAVGTLKKFPAPKFDPTVTLSFRLGVNPKKSDQMVRGSVSLPHGTGKNVRVAVFAQGDAAKAATEAGADFVGYEDLIKKVQGGFTDFDSAIATPDAMGEVRKIARVLGPRGLMPNPKTGTVTEDTAAAVVAAKAGKVD
ncbi:MAG: 50S ribosomal protein L1, partial [Akkermansiaceae bacterium]